MTKKLSIDFGTSFCSLCAHTPQGPEIIEIGGLAKIPSSIFWESNKNVLVGKAAENRFSDSNDFNRYKTSIKTELVNNLPIIISPTEHIMPVEAMAHILMFLIKGTDDYYKEKELEPFNTDVDEVTLTCPAYFTLSQLQLYKEALKIANIKNYTLTEDFSFLREPVAAALAHFNESQLEKGVLIYDLGGGTFDLSYVYRNKEGLLIIPVKPTGIQDCAGDSFDKRIYLEAEKKLQIKFNNQNRYDLRILADCRRMKESLSSKSSAKSQLISGPNGSFTLTRVDFQDLIRPSLEITMKQIETYLDKVVKETNHSLEDMKVLLIGGSTEIPLVKQMLDDTLKKIGINVESERHSNSDTAVAMGAAEYFPDFDNLQFPKESAETPSESYTSIYLKAKNQCPFCKKKLFGDSGICYHCGSMIDNMLIPSPIRNNKGIQEQIRKRISHLCEELKNVRPASSTTWSETSARYARAIERIKLMICSELSKDLTRDIDLKSWENALKQCENREFEIALVGSKNAGKSTLLNAVLGQDGLASTSVTPETSVLTKFCVTSISSLSIRVSYYNNEEWETIWRDVNNSDNNQQDSATEDSATEDSATDSSEEVNKNVFLEEYNHLQADSVKSKYLNRAPDLKLYNNLERLKSELARLTSSNSKMRFFIKEIEVFLNRKYLPDLPDSLKSISTDVLFIDAFGLNDEVKFRSDITEKYLSQADVVLLCMDKDFLTSAEETTNYSTVFRLCSSPDQVYLLRTKIDALESPEQNWNKQKEECVEKFKNDLYENEDAAQKRIVGVSAHIKNVLNSLSRCVQSDNNTFKDLLDIAVKMGYISSQDEGFNHPQLFNPGEDVYNKLMEFANIESLFDNIQSDFIQHFRESRIKKIPEDFNASREDLIRWMNSLIISAKDNLNMSNKEWSNSLDKQQELTDSLKDLEKTIKSIDEDFTEFTNSNTKRLEELKKHLEE